MSRGLRPWRFRRTTFIKAQEGGEAESSRAAFASAPSAQQRDLIDFLESLVLVPLDDTASNLNPGDPTASDFQQRGHQRRRAAGVTVKKAFKFPIRPFQNYL
jgi:hypothetical protein